MGKNGEGGTRGRLFAVPGRSPTNAKRHQCAVSPLVYTIEEVHIVCFNHTSFKGPHTEGKTNKMAELIYAHIPFGQDVMDDCVAFGYDTAANGRTWNINDWRQFQHFLHVCAEILLNELGDGYISQCFEADLSSDQIKIRVRFARFVMIMEAACFFLGSGINPTSPCNRYGGTVAIMAGVRQAHGDTEREKFKRWLFEPIAWPTDHPRVQAQVGHWAGFAKGYSYMSGNPDHGSPVAMVNEGDDLAANIRTKIVNKQEKHQRRRYHAHHQVRPRSLPRAGMGAGNGRHGIREPLWRQTIRRGRGAIMRLHRLR